MVITESGQMFSKSVDGSGEIKDKDFIDKHMRDAIMEVGSRNVLQIAIDSEFVCKTASMLIELEFPSIYWTPSVVHTLNIALENIFITKKYQKK